MCTEKLPQLIFLCDYLTLFIKYHCEDLCYDRRLLSLSLRDKKESFYILDLNHFNNNSHDSHNKFIIYNTDLNCQIIGEGNVTFLKLAFLKHQCTLFNVSKICVLMKWSVHIQTERIWSVGNLLKKKYNKLLLVYVS